MGVVDEIPVVDGATSPAPLETSGLVASSTTGNYELALNFHNVPTKLSDRGFAQLFNGRLCRGVRRARAVPSRLLLSCRFDGLDNVRWFGPFLVVRVKERVSDRARFVDDVGRRKWQLHRVVAVVLRQF